MWTKIIEDAIKNIVVEIVVTVAWTIGLHALVGTSIKDRLM
jgi:hypothetical protein